MDGQHEPTPLTRRQVEMMAAIGNPPGDIAQFMDIPLEQLRVHYQSELDIGLAKANNTVANNLYRQAIKDGPQSIKAAIFWLRTRAGWQERDPDQPSGGKQPPMGK